MDRCVDDEYTLNWKLSISFRFDANNLIAFRYLHTRTDETNILGWPFRNCRWCRQKCRIFCENHLTSVASSVCFTETQFKVSRSGEIAFIHLSVRSEEYIRCVCRDTRKGWEFLLRHDGEIIYLFAANVRDANGKNRMQSALAME